MKTTPQRNGQAVAAVGSQGMQALASITVQVLIARTLGMEALGAFALLFGIMVLAAAVASGLVGDSLVVLDREDRAVRSASQQCTLLVAALSALVAAPLAWAAGLVDPATAAVAGLAIALYSAEEVLRRLLMAGLRFWRVVLVDATAFAATLAVLAAVAAAGRLSLGAFLAAVAAGQATGILTAVALLPRQERRPAGFVRGGFRAVLGYGSWRAGQQLLRPAMLTGVRSLVTVLAGLGATGLLEAARTFVAPAVLLISGLSSYLFVAFARDGDTPVRAGMRRADRAVAALVGLTLGIGAALLALLPWAGPLLFGRAPDPLAVLGWIAYAASVAAVTPYGALAAARGRQAAVFTVRLADTLASVGLVAIVLLAGMPPTVAPAALAAASVLGGIALRLLVLRPLARAARSRPTPGLRSAEAGG